LTKQEYEARVNKLQVLMKDLQASAPYDIARQEHSGDFEPALADLSFASDASGMSCQADRLASSPNGMTTLFPTSPMVARHQTDRDAATSPASFRPAPPPATSPFKSHMPSPPTPKALGEAGGDAVDGFVGLETPWGLRNSPQAAEAAEKEVLAMLAAESNDGCSESSHQRGGGLAERQDSIASQDLGLMLDEVKRLDQMRALEANPQEKAEIKRQMQVEMKALLSQVQKTKAQVLQAEMKARRAQLQETPSHSSGQPRILTDRKAFEEGNGHRKTDPEEKAAAAKNRKQDPPHCVRNCMAWPGSTPG